MSFFSDIFSTNDSDALPDWLRSGAEIAEEGLELYDRIAQGSSEPEPAPMRTQAPSPTAALGSLGPMVMLAGAVVLLYLFFGISRRR